MRTLLLLAASALPLYAKAPIRPPVRLTPELMVGAWKYTWGSSDGCEIRFCADGTYRVRYSPDTGWTGFGVWSCSGSTIRIDEYGLDPFTGERLVYSAGRFDLAFDVKDYPDMRGTANGKTAVRLHSPTRPLED